MLPNSISFRKCCRTGMNKGVVPLLIAACCLAQPAAAQFGRAEVPDDSSILNVLIPAPREESRPLAVAERALEAEDYRRAFEQLGEILGIDNDDPLKPIDADREDFFLGPFGKPLTRRSLRLEAQRMIGQLSPKGRDYFESIYGGDAEALLKAAVNNRDMEKVATVSRLYFHTKAGYEATFLMGKHHLDEGRPVAAALALQRLVGSGAALSRFDPELSLLLATSWAIAGMPEKAESVLIELKHRRPNTSLNIGGVDVGYFQSDQAALSWLSQIVGSFQPIAQRTPSEWTVYRGDAARNSQCDGGLPLTKPRWEVPLLNEPKDEQAVEQLRKQYQDKNWAALPSLQPLAVGNWVLLRTPKELLGISFETGKRTWMYPGMLGDDEFSSTTKRNAHSLSSHESQLNQRVFDDIPYGQMSSNGETVYLIDKLGYVLQSTNAQRIQILRGGVPQPNPHWPREYNRLVALQLSGEGKFRWLVGGLNGIDEEKLAGAFFLGPPLPLFGELYALVEMDAEISLVVLDQETGRLNWRQQIASVESNDILTDIPRRLAGASPSFADGVLVCPTSSGAVVALDLSSRTLLWGFQFPRANFTRRLSGFGTTLDADSGHAGKRWADSTVTIADGRVIITPVESEKAFCLDLLTGESQWGDGIDRGDMLYLACVYDGKALFVGKDAIRAIQIKDGKQAWRTTFGNGAMPSGRGYLSEGYYYLPTNDAQLLKVDAKGGKIASRVQTKSILGNLICYRGDVISLSVDRLAVYRQEAPLREKVQAVLEKDPDDIWALLRRGELQLLDQEFDAAIESIRRAYKLSKQEDLDEVRTLLADAMLAAIRQDFAGNANLARELEAYLDSPDQLASYLRLTAQGKHKDGDLLGAFKIYQRLIAMDEATESDRTTAFSAESGLRNVDLRADRWLRARMTTLLNDAGPGERAKLDQEIKRYFDQSVKNGSTQKLREFVELFATHPLAAEAKLLLAERLTETEDYLLAEQLLLPLISDDNTAGPATARLAQLLEKAGQSASAVKFYKILERDFADVVCLNGETGRELCDNAIHSESLAPYRNGNQKWGSGRTEVDPSGDTVISSSTYLRVYPIQLEQVSAASPEGLQVMFDQRTSAIVVRDGLGATICRLTVKPTDGRSIYTSNYAVTYARVHGHLLLLSVGYDLLAVDLFQAAVKADEAVLWRVDLTQSIPPPTGRRSTRRRIDSTQVAIPWGRKLYRAVDEEGNLVGVTSSLSRNGLCYLRHSELVCLDPATGTTLWSRGRIDPGSDLFGDDEVVFVIPKNQQQAHAYSMIDGAPLGTRDLAGHENRWAAIGRHLLCWQETKENFNLEMYDPWLQKATWSKTFPPKTKAEILSGDELAVLQPDGDFLVLSLPDGTLRLKANVEPEQDLASIHVLRSSRQYLLCTNKNEIDYDEKRKIQPAPHGFQTPLVGGRVYAFDRSSGEPMWQVPAVIDQYGLPLDQPAELPLLTFLRHATPTVERGPRRTQTSILCLDRRDGRILLQKENIPAATHSYSVVGRPAEKAIRVQLPGQSFTFRFSDAPVPPEPPAQTGEASSLTADSSEINLGRMADAIINALP